MIWSRDCESQGVECDGLNEKCPSQAYIFQHLVPGWWHRLGRLWNLPKVEEGHHRGFSGWRHCLGRLWNLLKVEEGHHRGWLRECISLTLLLVLLPLLALDKDVISQLPVPCLCGHHGRSLWNDKSTDPRISCFESWSFMITTESKQHPCLPASTCFCQTLCYTHEKSDWCVKLKQPENAIAASGFVEEEARTGGNIQPYFTLYFTLYTPLTQGSLL